MKPKSKGLNFLKNSIQKRLGAQPNLSGPWENKSILWQYLLRQLNQTLSNLTLPEQFSIPCLNPARGFLTLLCLGPSYPAPNPDTFFKLAAR